MIKHAARLVLPLLVIALTVGPVGHTSAQGSASPPTILAFESSLERISLSEAENGTTSTTLRWEILGLRTSDRVVLLAYQVDAWVSLMTQIPSPLPAVGSAEIMVWHPHTFGSPTYKLAVLDAHNRAVDERTLTIPFTAASGGQPAITVFTTAADQLNANALAARSARITVTWLIADRQPNTNPVFEQVMPDGSTLNVELPRQSLWIPSNGAGELAPMLPPGGGPVVIQVRLVDVRNGTVLDQRTLPALPVTGSAAASAQAAVQAAPSQPVTSGAAPAVTTAGDTAAAGPLVIDDFSAAPSSVMRGGTLTLTWQVSGARQLSIWRLDPAGNLVEAAPNPTLTGSWTLTLDPGYTVSAGFLLFASDATGQQAQQSVTVRIQCGMLYFFGTDSQGGCPAGDAGTVQASFQPFEGGMMLTRADTSEIFVLFSTGQLGHYRDTWRGEAIAINEMTPPETIPPQRAFGKVWTENQVVRIRLGWATAPEQAYTMRYQPAVSGRLYVTLPNGTVIYLAESAWDYER